MRRVSANYIYSTIDAPLKNGIIEIDSFGKIINIVDTKGKLQESRNLEFYNGVIVPGFVNTHCHLELSELKNKFSQEKNLPDFIENIFNYKKQKTSEETIKSIELHDTLMHEKGIVAVGDICNTDNTIPVKVNSKIYYYNFIEAIGFGDADDIFNKNKSLLKGFTKNNLNGSIVPHAPYSISEELVILLKDFAEANDSILSIHNQETASENEMFIKKSGQLYKKLESLGVDMKEWLPSGKNSIESIIELLPKKNNFIFVHNTYSSENDIKIINDHISNAYFCLCPLSNLYIENKLPDLKLFLNYPNKVTIGTDSLASNRVLSILEEMKVIQNKCQDVEFLELIKWATINGAKALKIDKKYGSLEIGKTPGLNLIANFDFQKMKITEKSEVKVLA